MSQNYDKLIIGEVDLKYSSIFISLIIVTFAFQVSAEVSECTQMCGKLFDGTNPIIECYKKCNANSNYRENLRFEYNSSLPNSYNDQNNTYSLTVPNQAVSQPTAGRCGPNNVDTGSTCTPKSVYCSSLTCRTTRCSQCEGYQGEAASTNSNVDCTDPELAATKDCAATGAGTKAQGSDTAAAGDNCILPLYHRDSAGACRDSNNNIVNENADGSSDTVSGDSKRDPETGTTCVDARAEAADSCDSESKNWMSSLNDVVSTMGAAVSQVSQSSCGGIAAAQTGAASSLAAFQLMCNSAMKKCTNACTGSTLPADVAALAECKKIGVKAADANKSVASAMLTLKSSVAACQNAFGSMDQQATAYCTSNPSACAVTPFTPLQANSAQADQAGGVPNPSLATDTSGSAGAGASGLNMSALDDNSDSGIGTIAPSKPGEDPGGNKGGGHVGASTGGQGGGEATGHGGARKEGFISNILSGFFGGGGGSSGGGFFRKLFGGDNKADTYASNNLRTTKQTPDLRQFLPGGLKDPTRNRGIAGQFIGRDGMAGPHSDIWKNINNRYQYKRASLIP